MYLIQGRRIWNWLGDDIVTVLAEAVVIGQARSLKLVEGLVLVSLYWLWVDTLINSLIRDTRSIIQFF